VPLPTGVWRINVNGFTGELTLDAPDPTNGSTHGQLSLPSLAALIRGGWDEASQRLTFSLVQPMPDGGVQFLPQFFRGLLFRTPFSDSGTGQDIQWTLVGSVYEPVLNGDLGFTGSARRNEFGWHATLTQVQ
jgi:hypothetical protein